MRTLIARAVFSAWPFGFGHVGLMKMLSPPWIPAGDRTRTLRRYGLRIQYDPNTEIGRYLHYRGSFEEEILRAIERQLRPGATFVDVGANIGLHTIVAANLVGKHGRVIAFEPGSPMRSRLLRNLEINELTNVDVRPYALSRAEGVAELYMPNKYNDGQSSLAPSADSRSESVQLRTLDHEMRGVDFSAGCVLKIDVEGSEADVLIGGREFIRNVKPTMFVECIDGYLKKRGSSGAEVFQFLRDAGYELRALHRGKWEPVTQPVDCDLMATPR